MSFDLAVFESTNAPQNKKDFIKWYEQQVEWKEDHSYDNSEISSPALQKWFSEFIKIYPPMNGPLASDDIDNPKVTNYSIGKSIIYAAFAWSESENAYKLMKITAQNFGLIFFAISLENQEIVFPNIENKKNDKKENEKWKFWKKK